MEALLTSSFGKFLSGSSKGKLLDGSIFLKSTPEFPIDASKAVFQVSGPFVFYLEIDSAAILTIESTSLFNENLSVVNPQGVAQIVTVDIGKRAGMLSGVHTVGFDGTATIIFSLEKSVAPTAVPENNAQPAEGAQQVVVNGAPSANASVVQQPGSTSVTIPLSGIQATVPNPQPEKPSMIGTPLGNRLSAAFAAQNNTQPTGGCGSCAAKAAAQAAQLAQSLGSQQPQQIGAGRAPIELPSGVERPAAIPSSAPPASNMVINV